MTSKTVRRLSINEVTASFFLNTCTLKDVVQCKEKSGDMRQLVCVSNKTSTFDALKKMLDCNVNSIIIYRLDHQEKKKIYISIVTSLDIAYWFSWKKRDVSPKDVPLSELSGITDETRKLWSFPITQHLDSVVQPFMQGVHALICLRQNHSVRKVFISQWDVVKFIFSMREYISKDFDFFKVTVGESSLMKHLSETVCVKEKSQVLKGFELMSKSEFNAVAVVNDEGKFVSTLKSKHALKLLDKNTENEMVKKTVGQFLSDVDEPFGIENQKNIIQKETTVEEMVEIVIDNHVHRMWLLDAENRPLYVVTLSDLIKEIALYDFYRDYVSESYEENSSH